MSNSPLVKYTKISPNKTSPRNHCIDTITIHCTAGQVTLESLGNIFAPESVQASCNYGISHDGKIGMYVEERDRSWCSSNRANDNRAITIEVSSEAVHPYAVNKAAYDALITLLVDVCKRNHIKKLLWKADPTLVGQIDKQNMTVHRWFANKACPGDYLFSRHGEIARLVNERLGCPCDKKSDPVESTPVELPVQIRVTTDCLRLREGPGTNYKEKGYVDPGVYTICEECSGEGANSWGKLKSGAGWIALDYTTRV